MSHLPDETHYACPDALKASGGEAKCCACSGHKCSQLPLPMTVPPQPIFQIVWMPENFTEWWRSVFQVVFLRRHVLGFTEEQARQMVWAIQTKQSLKKLEK